MHGLGALPDMGIDVAVQLRAEQLQLSLQRPREGRAGWAGHGVGEGSLELEKEEAGLSDCSAVGQEREGRHGQLGAWVSIPSEGLLGGG